MERKNYKVEIRKAEGTCDSELFRLKASKGDITASRLSEMVGKVVDITGYAECHITTDEKEFDMKYYNTNSGTVSSGSAIFLESVQDYMKYTTRFAIKEVKTKRGKTYKGDPIIVDDSTGEVVE